MYEKIVDDNVEFTTKEIGLEKLDLTTFIRDIAKLQASCCTTVALNEDGNVKSFQYSQKSFIEIFKFALFTKAPQIAIVFTDYNRSYINDLLELSELMNVFISKILICDLNGNINVSFTRNEEERK